MDIQAIEKFCQDRGLKIAQTLVDKYDSADFETDVLNIEQEIYEIATSYSRIFFFEVREFLSDSVRDEVRTHLSSRFDPKPIKKMKDVDLLSHWIKSEVISVLENKGIFL